MSLTRTLFYTTVLQFLTVGAIGQMDWSDRPVVPGRGWAGGPNNYAWGLSWLHSALQKQCSKLGCERFLPRPFKIIIFLFDTV